MIDLTKLSPEQAAGLSHVNEISNAARKTAWDRGEGQKVAAAPPEAPYTPQAFVPETDQDYAERVLGGVFDSYAAQRAEYLKSQILPELDETKVKGLRAYLSASPAVQAQVKQLLGV